MSLFVPVVTDSLQGATYDLGSPRSVSIFTIDGTEYAFVVSTNALSIFDISDPYNLSLESSLTGSGSPNYLNGAFDVAVAQISGTEYAFVACYNGDFSGSF